MLNGIKDNNKNIKIVNHQEVYDAKNNNKNVNDKQVNSGQLNTMMSLSRYNENRQSSKQISLSLSPNPNSNNDNNSHLYNNKRNTNFNNMGSSISYPQKKSVVFEKPEISIKQVMTQLDMLKRKSSYMPTKDLEQK